MILLLEIAIIILLINNNNYNRLKIIVKMLENLKIILLQKNIKIYMI